jgi:hypothetical protein
MGFARQGLTVIHSVTAAVFLHTSDSKGACGEGELFIAVLLGVRDRCLFGMPSSPDFS